MCYLQITTRCNMRCEHCGFSCTENGEDMTMDVVHAALREFGGDLISIGGGEPLLHAKFWTILIECLTTCEGVWLATNGSCTADAIRLARLAKKVEHLSVELSLDAYHSDIDPCVSTEFTRCGQEIRDVTGNEIAAGRAVEWAPRDGCVCADAVIRPNGDVFVCGCLEVQAGNVLTGVDYDVLYEYSGYCSKDL